MSLLDPLSHALAAVIAAAHASVTSLGADDTSGSVWLLCIAAVVVVVRLALLPLAAHGVRLAHASARARPHLQELAERYRDRKDPDSIRRHMEERRRISADVGQLPPLEAAMPCCAEIPAAPQEHFGLDARVHGVLGAHGVLIVLKTEHEPRHSDAGEDGRRLRLDLTVRTVAVDDAARRSKQQQEYGS